MLALSAPAAGGAPYALIGSLYGGQTAGSSLTSGSLNTTGADLIVAAMSYYAGTDQPVLTDSKANAFTVIGASNPGGTGAALVLVYKQAPVVGSGHTFTMANSGGIFGGFAIAAFSGSIATPLDQVNYGSTFTSTMPLGGVAPVQNKELLVSGAGCSNANNLLTPDSGFTFLTGNYYSPSGPNAEGIGLAYLIQTTATSVALTWTVSSGASNAGDGAVIASFKGH